LVAAPFVPINLRQFLVFAPQRIDNDLAAAVVSIAGARHAPRAASPTGLNSSAMSGPQGAIAMTSSNTAGMDGEACNGW
jgi:hypothetical protein